VRRTIFLLGAASLILALAPAGAASTQPAAGTFVEGPENITDERQADGNFIIELTRSVVFTGTYTGTGQADERIVIHKDGSTNVNITIEFTGLSCGVPETLVFLVVGQGQLDENFEMGTIEGSYTILQEGVGHGSGKFSGMAGVGGNYEGEAHCL
jgi:hypothetical protein